MRNVIKGIWNGVTTALVVLVIVLAVMLWGVRFLGIEIFVVQSGSMEPAIPTGAVVYVQKVDTAKLQVGDVITFHLTQGTKGTHRIVEVLRDGNELSFRTKGDANENVDNSLVDSGDVVGKTIFSIPYLGYVVSYIQQPPGLYAAVAAAAVVLLLIILPDIIFDSKTKQEVSHEESTDL